MQQCVALTIYNNGWQILRDLLWAAAVEAASLEMKIFINCSFLLELNGGSFAILLLEMSLGSLLVLPPEIVI